MAEMSGPWAPFEAPLDIHWITDPRCRRLLFMSTRVWSGASPRRLTGRSSAARSREGLSLTGKASNVSNVMVAVQKREVARLGSATAGSGE